VKLDKRDDGMHEKRKMDVEKKEGAKGNLPFERTLNG
jgi:hypothetical protein